MNYLVWYELNLACSLGFSIMPLLIFFLHMISDITIFAVLHLRVS